MALQNYTEFKKKHQILIESLDYYGIGVNIIDQNYNILYFNNVLRENFGIPHREKCYEHYLQRNIACESCPMQRSIKNNHIEQEIISTPDNRIYKIISAPLLNKYGKIDRAFEIVIDITEEIEFEKRLQESEFNLKKAQEISHIGHWKLNTITEEVIGSNELFNIFKLSHEEATLNAFAEIVHPDDREYDLYHIRRGIGEGIPWDIEHRLICKDGTEKWIHAIGNPIKDETGKILMILGTVQDITEFKLAEQKLKESEEKYRSLFDLSPVGIGIGTPDGRTIAINDRLRKMTGYLMEDESEIPIKELYVNIDDRIELFNSLKENEEVKDFETTLIRKDGSLFDVLINVVFIDIDGERCSLAVIEDITERKKADELLKASELMLQESQEIGKIGSFEMDLATNDVVWSDQLYKLFGLKKEGRTIDYEKVLALIHPDDRERAIKVSTDAAKELKPYTLEHRVIHPDGEILDLLITGDVIRNEKNEIVKLGGTIQDITDAKKVEKELRGLSKLKSELLTRTSHELNTPAMHIKGYADLLLHDFKSSLGADELQIISHIKKGALRLETLIHDILHKAELDSGYGELKKTQNDLSSLINLSVKELKSFAVLRGHSIILDIDDAMIINFDKEQMRHVINNLITNAIKYTPLNGIIGINSTITDNFITIAIQDNGIGLTEEHINRLFTQFGKIERYGQGFDIITEGSGLGLYIAKKIIDIHGGRIWVESRGTNKGSTFYFSLPKGEES